MHLNGMRVVLLEEAVADEVVPRVSRGAMTCKNLDGTEIMILGQGTAAMEWCSIMATGKVHIVRAADAQGQNRVHGLPEGTKIMAEIEVTEIGIANGIDATTIVIGHLLHPETTKDGSISPSYFSILRRLIYQRPEPFPSRALCTF